MVLNLRLKATVIPAKAGMTWILETTCFRTETNYVQCIFRSGSVLPRFIMGRDAW